MAGERHLLPDRWEHGPAACGEFERQRTRRKLRPDGGAHPFLARWNFASFAAHRSPTATANPRWIGQPASRALLVSTTRRCGAAPASPMAGATRAARAQTCRLGACPTLNPPPALGAGRRRPPISDADRRVRGPRAPRTPLGAHGASSSAASPVRGCKGALRGGRTPFGGPPLERITTPVRFGGAAARPDSC